MIFLICNSSNIGSVVFLNFILWDKFGIIIYLSVYSIFLGFGILKSIRFKILLF